MATRKAHHSCVTEKDVTGISLLKWSGDSRTAFALRLFCRLGAPSFGQPGGRSRKARRCSTGLPTPVRSALPFGSGKAVHNRNWSNIMRKSASTGAPRAIVIPFPRFNRPAHRNAPVDFSSPDFDAGFQFALALVKGLKARGQLYSLKGL